MSMSKSIFVAGGTGYIGSRLIPLLRKRGFKVKAIVRAGSEKNYPRVPPMFRKSARSAGL
jgi:nucleoside-diphosphate-sugar epimerase